MKRLKERFRKSAVGMPQPVQQGQLQGQQQQQQQQQQFQPQQQQPAYSRPSIAPIPENNSQSWQVVDRSNWSGSSTSFTTNTTNQPPPQSTSTPSQSQHLSPPASLAPPHPSPSPTPGSTGSIFAAIFNDPQILIKLAQNPRTQLYLTDFSFLGRLERLRQQPERTQEEVALDPRVQDVINVILGIPLPQPSAPSPLSSTGTAAAPNAPVPTITPPIPAASPPRTSASPVIQQPIPQAPQQSSPILNATTAPVIPPSPAVSYSSTTPSQTAAGPAPIETTPTPQPVSTPYKIPPPLSSPQELPTNASWERSPTLDDKERTKTPEPEVKKEYLGQPAKIYESPSPVPTPEPDSSTPPPATQQLYQRQASNAPPATQQPYQRQASNSFSSPPPVPVASSAAVHQEYQRQISSSIQDTPVAQQGYQRQASGSFSSSTQAPVLGPPAPPTQEYQRQASGSFSSGQVPAQGSAPTPAAETQQREYQRQASGSFSNQVSVPLVAGSIKVQGTTSSAPVQQSTASPPAQQTYQPPSQSSSPPIQQTLQAPAEVSPPISQQQPQETPPQRPFLQPQRHSTYQPYHYPGSNPPGPTTPPSQQYQAYTPQQKVNTAPAQSFQRVPAPNTTQGPTPPAAANVGASQGYFPPFSQAASSSIPAPNVAPPSIPSPPAQAPPKIPSPPAQAPPGIPSLPSLPSQAPLTIPGLPQIPDGIIPIPIAPNQAPVNVPSSPIQASPNVPNPPKVPDGIIPVAPNQAPVNSSSPPAQSPPSVPGLSQAQQRYPGPPTQAPPTIPKGPVLAPATIPSPPAQSPPPPPPNRTEEANRIKVQANQAFGAKNFHLAIQLYTTALSLDPKNAVILSNRSSAFLLVQPPQYLSAYADAKAATEAEPNYWKGWSRLGESKLKLDDPEGAVEAFEWAEALAGDQLGEATKASLRTARDRVAILKKQGKLKYRPNSMLHSAPHSPPSQPVLTGPSASTSTVHSSASPPAAPPKIPIQCFSQAPQVSPLQKPSTIQQERPANSNSPPVQAPGPNSGPIQNLTEGVNRINLSSAANPSQPPNIGEFRENPNASQQGQEASEVSGRAVSDNNSTINNSADFLHTAGLANLARLDNPNTPEEPPQYVPNLVSNDPLIRRISAQNIADQLNTVTTTLALKNKGSVAIRPYVGYGPDRSTYVDAVRVVFLSLAQTELTPYLRGESKSAEHVTFEGMFMNTLNYPGTVFHDMDMEVSRFYEGYYPGTVGVAGYSEEYRAQQLETKPVANITLFSNDAMPPALNIERIIQRFQSSYLNPLVFGTQTIGQLYNDLRELVPAQRINFNQIMQNPSSMIGLKNQISDICLVLNRDDPSQFRDFTKERNIFNHIFNLPAASGNSRGLGFRAFLFQLLLGYELYLRLLCEPSFPPPGLITNSVAATMQLAIQFKANVDVIRNNTLGLAEPFLVVSRVEQRQREGLLKFAELINWPYIHEARSYLTTAYSQMGSGGSVGLDTCDWLFGLIAPGKIFRHRIMCTLVEASAPIRSIKAAPHYNDGLVTPLASYWPKRTPLGRVLGGLENSKSIVGWIGPAPAPKNAVTGAVMPSGWYLIYSELPRIPIPCTRNPEASADLEEQGFGRPDPDDLDATRWLSGITDVNNWVAPSLPKRADLHTSTVTLTSIRLAEHIPASALNNGLYTPTPPQPKWHKATLDFHLLPTNERISYTLHYTPIFMSAHPCVGEHVLHKQQTAKYLEGSVTASRLHHLPPSRPLNHTRFLFIDARAKGEEVLARAWCAQNKRHAVIRRGGGQDESCFACACQAAGSYGGKGVAFNVLIWAS